jgi:hypothetical protein
MKKTKPTTKNNLLAGNSAASAHRNPPALSDSARRAGLSRLLPLWPHEISDLSIAGRRRIIATLEKALRAERRRGHAGHWAYDLARHAALVKNLKSESAALQTFEICEKSERQKIATQRQTPTIQRSYVVFLISGGTLDRSPAG